MNMTELRAYVASNQYGAELALQHAMRLLDQELAAATGERDALRLACARLDDDKESNARLCESLAAELATEQALADRLARSISRHDFDGGHTPQRQQRALAAWKEARP